MSARVILLAATVALCAGCSSDSPTSSGAPDTAPPTVVGVTPQDVYHFTVTFDETLSKPSAENPDNYLLVAQGYSMMMAGVPGDTMRVVPVLSPDHKTVAVSVYPAMVNLTMGLTVSGLSDTRGNRMENSSTKTFESGTSADETPPFSFSRYLMRSPYARAIAAVAPPSVEPSLTTITSTCG